MSQRARPGSADPKAKAPSAGNQGKAAQMAAAVKGKGKGSTGDGAASGKGGKAGGASMRGAAQTPADDGYGTPNDGARARETMLSGVGGMETGSAAGDSNYDEMMMNMKGVGKGGKDVTKRSQLKLKIGVVGLDASLNGDSNMEPFLEKKRDQSITFQDVSLSNEHQSDTTYGPYDMALFDETPATFVQNCYEKMFKENLMTLLRRATDNKGNTTFGMEFGVTLLYGARKTAKSWVFGLEAQDAADISDSKSGSYVTTETSVLMELCKDFIEKESMKKEWSVGVQAIGILGSKPPHLEKRDQDHSERNTVKDLLNKGKDVSAKMDDTRNCFTSAKMQDVESGKDMLRAISNIMEAKRDIEHMFLSESERERLDKMSGNGSKSAKGSKDDERKLPGIPNRSSDINTSALEVIKPASLETPQKPCEVTVLFYLIFTSTEDPEMVKTFLICDLSANDLGGIYAMKGNKAAFELQQYMGHLTSQYGLLAQYADPSMLQKISQPPYDPSKLLNALAPGLFGLPKKIADPQIIGFVDAGDALSYPTLEYIEYLKKRQGDQVDSRAPVFEDTLTQVMKKRMGKYKDEPFKITEQGKSLHYEDKYGQVSFQIWEGAQLQRALRQSKVLHQQGKEHKAGADLQLLFDAGRVDLWRAAVEQAAEVESLRKENDRIASKYEEAGEKMKRMEDELIRKTRELEQKIKRAEFEKQQVEQKFDICKVNTQMLDAELKRYAKMVVAQEEYVDQVLGQMNHQVEIAFPED